MPWTICADVHGAHDLLAAERPHNGPLFLLGDNLNLVDFHTLSGVAARVLSKADIGRIVLAIATGGPKKALKLADKLFFRNPEKIARARVEILKDYGELAKILPESARVIHGNVDWPDLLEEALGERYRDVGVEEIDGVRVGFLSGTGSYPYSMHLPGESDDDTYREKLFSLGPVDMLCTHFPPDIDGLTYDVVAKRSEGGSRALLDYLDRYQPRLHLFGHIHNPQVPETKRGNTRLVNVGGFRYNGGRTFRFDPRSFELVETSKPSK